MAHLHKPVPSIRAARPDVPPDLEAAIVRMLETLISEVHSVMVVRHGKVVAEGWWAPYAPQDIHVLYSVTKSFNSKQFCTDRNRNGVIGAFRCQRQDPGWRSESVGP
jgi:hypothetical protein